MIKRLRTLILKVLILSPLPGKYRLLFYKKLGIKFSGNCTIDRNVHFLPDYDKICLGNNVSIRSGSLFVAYDEIKIGDNTAIAYQVTILTSAVPGGQYNKLFNIYKRIKKPVEVGHDCWIGTRATIFPGVRIGNYCVIAAGSVVRDDVPDYSVVAGVPAKIVKKLNPEDLK